MVHFPVVPSFLECFLHFHSLEELYGVSAAVHLSDALYIALQFLWLIGILSHSRLILGVTILSLNICSCRNSGGICSSKLKSTIPFE